jgi:endo-1,4-beta-xylanase
MTSPVLVLIFNRPETTIKVFEKIRATRPPKLYISADGPRSNRPGELERCEEARKIALGVDWPCEVKTLFRESNLGCKMGVASGIDWFFQNEDGKPKTKDEVIERLREHIKTIAGRYAGKVNAWDVVNEVIDEDGNYRQTTWVKGIGSGDELVKLAFKYAAEYAPNTELYYNDFNEWRPTKRDGIVKMVKMLQKEGIKIDGIGMQGHWGLDYPKTEYIEAAIEAYAALGVKVMITELDVDVLPLTKDGQVVGQGMSDKQFQNEEFKTTLDPYSNGLPAEVQTQLANRYAQLFEIFYRKRDKIDRVTMWGVHDGMSWKNNYPVPKRTNYPLLWDRIKQPKPAYDAVLNLPNKLK